MIKRFEMMRRFCVVVFRKRHLDAADFWRVVAIKVLRLIRRTAAAWEYSMSAAMRRSRLGKEASSTSLTRQCEQPVLENDMATIILRVIYRYNLSRCRKIMLKDHQWEAIKPSVGSLAEPVARPIITALGVFAKSTVPGQNILIGFIMYSREISSGEYYIDTIFIDIFYRGRGFGLVALKLAIMDIVQQRDFNDPIYILLRKTTIHAETFFRKVGFKNADKPGGTFSRYLCFSSQSIAQWP